MKEYPGMKLGKIDIVEKHYNSQGQIVREEWHFYYPEEVEPIVQGFGKNPKAKKKQL